VGWLEIKTHTTHQFNPPGERAKPLTSGASARRVCAWGHAQTSRVLWTGPFWVVRHAGLEGLRN